VLCTYRIVLGSVGLPTFRSHPFSKELFSSWLFDCCVRDGKARSVSGRVRLHTSGSVGGVAKLRADRCVAVRDRLLASGIDSGVAEYVKVGIVFFRLRPVKVRRFLVRARLRSLRCVGVPSRILSIRLHDVCLRLPALGLHDVSEELLPSRLLFFYLWLGSVRVLPLSIG